MFLNDPNETVATIDHYHPTIFKSYLFVGDISTSSGKHVVNMQEEKYYPVSITYVTIMRILCPLFWQSYNGS